MNIEFFYLLNLLLVARLIFYVKDEPISKKRLVIILFIELVGLSVIEINLKWFAFLLIIFIVNIIFYLFERKTKNINGIRLISLLIFIILISIFTSNSLNLTLNKNIFKILLNLEQFTSFAILLKKINWVNFSIILCGLLIILNEVNIFIRYLFQIFDLIPKTKKEIDTKEYNAGRIIGLLERILIFLFVLKSQYTAIGFILAAKGFTRFKELEKRERAEYVLIGTLLSTLLAITFGLVSLKLMK